MRIGMVCPYSFDAPGGVQAHAIDLCSEFRRRGHEVSLAGPAGPHADVPDWVVRGGRSLPIPYNGSVARLAFGPITWRRVRRWIAEGDFDVLHIHEPSSPSWSMFAMANAVGPLVATYHSAMARSRLLEIVLPVLRPFLERIRGGIAVSDVARRSHVEKVGGDPVLIPNGVRIAEYEEGPGLDDATVRAEAGIGPAADGILRLVFLGRFDEPRKGMDVLLGALSAIVRAHPDVEIVIIGDGDRDAARRKARHNADHLRFLGRLSERAKTAVLKSADAYIAPQTGGESFGIVLVEAMAAGAPVIASDLDAFRLVLGDGRWGAQFTNGDSADLARAVADVLADPDRRTTMVAEGHRRAWDYDWSVIADRVLAVYDTVRSPGEKVRLT